MNQPVEDLATQRERLRREIQASREQLRGMRGELQKPLEAASRLRDRFKMLRRRGVYFLPAIAALVLLRPRQTLRLLAAVVSAWRIYQHVRALGELHHRQRALPAPAGRPGTP